jgi:hypothetical protein
MEADYLSVKVWIPDTDTPCRFFPDSWSDPKHYRGPANLENLRLSVRICKNDCLVRDECLVQAMREEKDCKKSAERVGIRGGLTPRERQKLANKLRSKNASKQEAKAQGQGSEEAAAS